MGKRMRRFTASVDLTGSGSAAVSGARDFEYDDGSEFDFTPADDEGCGDPVKMKTGPGSFRFELLASSSSVVTGYCKTLVIVSKEITYANGAETSADKTYTFTDCTLVVGGNMPTESPGRIPVSGQYKSLGIS